MIRSLGIAARLALLLGALLTAASVGAGTPLDSPQQAVEAISGQLRETIRTQGPRLRRDAGYARSVAEDLLDRHGDPDRTAELVLGEGWRRANATQREAFRREFRLLLLRSYSAVLQSLGDWELQPLPAPVEAQADEARVRTRVVPARGAPVDVEVALHRLGSEWRVYDLAFGGIRVSAGLRLSFSVPYRLGGIDGLTAGIAAMNRARLPAMAATTSPLQPPPASARKGP